MHIMPTEFRFTLRPPGKKALRGIRAYSEKVRHKQIDLTEQNV